MTGIFALTRQAAVLGRRLRQHLPQANLYIPERHREVFPGCSYFPGSFPAAVAARWKNHRRLIFIMAAGIVVRSIAPLLQNKQQDPAVVVLDERGRYVIPLLSGHWGGANDLAREIADYLGSSPVITTASDVEGFSALDDVARKNNCRLSEGSNWKAVASLIIEGRPVGLISTVRISLQFPENVRELEPPYERETLSFRPEGMIYITEYNIDHLAGYFPESFAAQIREKSHVILRPRNLVLGVGCRKGKSKKEILSGIYSVLGDLGLSPESIACLATVELKKDEPGLNGAAAELGVKLTWCRAQEIASIDKYFEASSFVKDTVGVGAVAEPAAWLTAREPQLVAGKRKFAGVTVAVVKDRAVEIRDK